MARKPKRIDISHVPELVRLAEEVRTTGEPRVLRHASEDLAILMPIARGPEDVGVAGEEPRSKRRKAHLMSLAGAWSDLDADRMIEELYKARHEAPPSAPPQP